jgi:predicted alpha-1,6-mannanase (GH76 family)
LDAWAERAELLQESLERYYGAHGLLDWLLWRRPFRNWQPAAPGDAKSLNYWWLAHAIEARLDAYERTGSPGRLEQAERIFRYVVRRNGRSLFNDCFDDMGWLGLAVLRLFDLSGSSAYLSAASSLWSRIQTRGWNGTAGGGIAWREGQLHYKNTPSNGPFVILGARLYERTGSASYLEWASRAFEWLDGTLRRPDGFVDDGINRQGDGRVDDWKLSYNQGLYMGAGVSLAAAADRRELIPRAFETEQSGYAALARDGVFLDGDNGDAAMFKGIWYRYAASLALASGADPAALRVREHLLSGGEVLWARGFRAGSLLAGPDWRSPPTGRVPLTAQLAAVIATEACAKLTA